MGLRPAHGNGGRRGRYAGWALPAGLALAAIAASLAGEAAREALRWSRPALADGQAWRLLTGHVAHLGTAHLAMNLAALAVIWLLVGRRHGVRAWLAVLAIVIATIDAAFWWLVPQLDWYVGLSGVLHGLLVAGLLAGLRDAPLESTLLLLAIAAKLAWEQFAGPLPGSAETAGGPVVVDAHLYGAVGGLAGAGVAWFGSTRSRSI